MADGRCKENTSFNPLLAGVFLLLQVRSHEQQEFPGFLEQGDGVPQGQLTAVRRTGTRLACMKSKDTPVLAYQCLRLTILLCCSYGRCPLFFVSAFLVMAVAHGSPATLIVRFVTVRGADFGMVKRLCGMPHRYFMC